MEEKYIVWHIEGGLGKNVAGTALLTSLQQKYPDRKIIVVASYPEIFLNHPDAHRVYKMGSTQYFYDDYIKDVIEIGEILLSLNKKKLLKI
jgi:uncharacterized phage-like protein YoqJ